MATKDGIFSTPSYITIDDPYSGEHRSGEPRHRGRQFIISIGKKGRGNDAFFDPFKRLFEDEEYVDIRSYKDVERKLGFLASTAPQRDEFSYTRRAAQLKELLTKEETLRKTHSVNQVQLSTDLYSTKAGMLATYFHSPELQYDVDKVDISDPCMKCHHDLHRCPHKVAKLMETIPEPDPLRDRTSSSDYGRLTLLSTTGYVPAKHAHRPIIAASFYRRQGVLPR
ncbi:hypothetical protein CBR_g26244 [Chara braunii]|uniref:Cilia-and flagella-associated protein 96 n=1 Tax=Chara braunii TaxID=69332 RepID=A0A388L7A8_CHABU|nr:hypothetical protein CBR_g26244 [Chara braunii]|eukprot:GBG78211.1 hypothetical protein CBR_g26244 [Chara braunii]